MKKRRLAAWVISVFLLCLAAWAAGPGDDGALEGSVAPSSLAGRVASVLRSTGLPDALVVMLIAALPVIELRGAIPAGFMMGMNPWLVFVLALVGNMLPIPFILLLLGPISRVCMKVRAGRVFFEWLFARTRRKTAKIEKYETLGLTVFVAIPLPATGGWTGAMAAFLLGLSFRHAMWSIFLGVTIAGLIMLVLSWLGWLGALVAGVVLIALAIGALLQMFKRE